MKIGETLELSFRVSNVGLGSGTYHYSFVADGDTKAGNLVLHPSKTATVDVSVQFTGKGHYSIRFDKLVYPVEVFNELDSTISKQYSVIDPRLASADPAAYIGTKVELAGQVDNVQQLSSETWISLLAENPTSGSESVVIRTTQPMLELRSDIYIRVYGYGIGTEQVVYTFTGATNTVPGFRADYLIIEATTEQELEQLYDQRYLSTSVAFGQTSTMNGLEITVLRYGFFPHLEYGTWGDRVESLRIDLKVQNASSQKHSLYDFNAILLDDKAGQYIAAYSSVFESGDIFPDVIKGGYLLFDNVNPQAQSFRLIWEMSSYPPSDVQFSFPAP